jgi:hypothetical protein
MFAKHISKIERTGRDGRVMLVRDRFDQVQGEIAVGAAKIPKDNLRVFDLETCATAAMDTPPYRRSNIT